MTLTYLNNQQNKSLYKYSSEEVTLEEEIKNQKSIHFFIKSDEKFCFKFEFIRTN